MLVGLCALSMLSCVGVHEDDDIISAPTVDTEQGGSATGTRFYHRILTYEYTASWCQYCPNMAAALAEAKKERDFATADAIRTELDQQGSILMDSVNGTSWDIKSIYNA